MSYTDVFGNVTLPPSEYGYERLTISENTILNWPYNSNGNDVTAKIMEVDATSSSLTLSLPNATEVSTGEDLLVVNVGSNSFVLNDADGVPVVTIPTGAAKYIYLLDNSTAAGGWGVVSYGVGTSSVDAATLVGYGIKAIGASLNQSHPVLSSATPETIDSSYRAKTFVYTGGSDTLPLSSAVSLGDDFFFFLRNNGTGTLTIDPNGGETIDGQSTLTLQPTESMIVVCSGSNWYSVGYGRSVLYNFTQLVKDLSAGGTITLTPVEASNKLMTFVGSPASGVIVIVPSVVAVYYLQSSLSTAVSVTVKTSSGTGVAVPQGQRAIVICDSTNVVGAQSATVSSFVSLIDGSVTTPSLNFSSATNTGIYKYSTSGVGVSANGVLAAYFNPTGTYITGPTTLNGRVTIEGVTSTGATGTGKVVFGTTPTLTTPILNTPILNTPTLNAPVVYPTAEFLASSTTTQDGVVISGRAGGSNSYRVTIAPTTLTASRAITLPDAAGSIVVSEAANTFTNASGQTFLASTTATQDGVVINGRAGGSNSYRVTIAPTTLSANRSVTLPDAAGAIVITDATQTLTAKTVTGLLETRVAVAASAIDLALGNYFTKTISGTTTFTVSNTPATGTVGAFILELTNGGSATVNFPSGTKWGNGIAPSLTVSGVDILAFYTHNGGTTWRAAVVALDSK